MLTVDAVSTDSVRNIVSPISMIDVLLRYSPTDLVSNVKTKIVPFSVNNQVWPLTLNDAEYHNSLICSPYTTYVTYGVHELKRLPKWWVKLAVLCNFAVMSCLCRL